MTTEPQKPIKIEPAKPIKIEVEPIKPTGYRSDDNFKLTGHFGHILLIICAVFLVVFFVWAYFAVLDEVTSANGKVIPASKTQLIQNLEGGIVEKILVKEGQIVEKNQILMTIDDVKFSSEYREGALKETALKIRLARLEAELKNKPFAIPAELRAEFPTLAESELALYNSKKSERKSLLAQRNLIQQEIDMSRPLIKLGAVSKVEVLRLEQQLTAVNKEISKFRSASLQELNAVKAEASRIRESNMSLKDKLERTDVRSPVRGIVEQIHISTEGGVIKPGMPLLEVVPLDDTLLIEAQVRPKDIGFLHIGQKAMVKISAYDFSIYGGLEGKVEHISADTSVDPKGNSYYEIWVRTDRNYLQKNDQKLNIMPGMQATVDILTGEKTVMDYLLKPILKTKHKALRER